MRGTCRSCRFTLRVTGLSRSITESLDQAVNQRTIASAARSPLHDRIWSRLVVAFAGIHVAQVSVVYAVGWPSWNR